MSAADRANMNDPLQSGSSAPQPSEPTLEQAIGVQIRQHRRRLELTGAELATTAGVSTGMLSKIENGQISASLTTLQSLAKALNLPLSALFTPFEEQRDCAYVKAGQGVRIERRGTRAGHRYELLGRSLGGHVVVEPYLIHLSDEAQPYPAFQHAGVEFLYMLSGRVLYRHADRAYQLGPGDSLFFDASAPHGPEELIELPMSFLAIIAYARE